MIWISLALLTLATLMRPLFELSWWLQVQFWKWEDKTLYADLPRPDYTKPPYTRLKVSARKSQT